MRPKETYIPQLNRLTEVSLVWGEDTSNVAVTVIPAQKRVTLQILSSGNTLKISR